jgi:hypothetical protein
LKPSFQDIKKVFNQNQAQNHIKIAVITILDTGDADINNNPYPELYAIFSITKIRASTTLI